MSYTRDDVRKVREAIAATIPDARFVEGDYGFGLGVAKPDLSDAWTLFECDPKTGETLVQVTKGDVPKVIELLRT